MPPLRPPACESAVSRNPRSSRRRLGVLGGLVRRAAARLFGVPRRARSGFGVRSVLRTGRILDTPPLRGSCECTEVHFSNFKDMTLFGALECTCEMDAQDGNFENNARQKFS